MESLLSVITMVNGESVSAGGEIRRFIKTRHSNLHSGHSVGEKTMSQTDVAP